MNESQSQTEFFKLILNYPRIFIFWNRYEKSCNIEALMQSMETMSHSEIILSKFFMSVWLGENKNFNFLEAASSLGENERRMIAAWFINPFWP